jgi:hypothetical protein
VEGEEWRACPDAVRLVRVVYAKVICLKECSACDLRLMSWTRSG